MRKNLLFVIVGFCVNTLIGFFIAPYIIENVGLEAYGYVSLGNQFVSYAVVIGIALNSMSTRFISIEYHRKNFQKANEYFSSVVLFNVFVCGLILLPLIYFIKNIQNIISISDALVSDVQLLFVLLFANFLISSILNQFTVCYFTQNTLYIKSAREIESKVLYLLVIVGLFYIYQPTLYFIGVATLCSTIYNSFFGWFYTTKSTPEITFKYLNFKFNSLREIFLSGFWNLVTHLGQILMQGLDLIMVNLFLSATIMGELALSKTIPIIVMSLVGTLANTYTPIFNKLVAINDREALKLSLTQSMKLLGLFTNVPIVVFFGFGEDFYRLWVPSGNAMHLQYMSILAMSTMIISGPVNTIYNYFSSLNKVRYNSILVIFSGLLNIAIVYILIFLDIFNVYTMLTVNLVVVLGKNFFFTIPYAAKMLGVSQFSFNKVILKSFITFLIIYFVIHGLKNLITITDWYELIFCTSLSTIIALVLNILLIFSRHEVKGFLTNKYNRN